LENKINIEGFKLYNIELIIVIETTTAWIWTMNIFNVCITVQVLRVINVNSNRKIYKLTHICIKENHRILLQFILENKLYFQHLTNFYCNFDIIKSIKYNSICYIELKMSNFSLKCN
jgi:hypothetical protein